MNASYTQLPPFHIVRVEGSQEQLLQENLAELKTLKESQTTRISREWVKDVKRCTEASAQLLKTIESTDRVSQECLYLSCQIRNEMDFLNRKVKEIKSENCRGWLIACGLFLAAAVPMTAFFLFVKDPG